MGCSRPTKKPGRLSHVSTPEVPDQPMPEGGIGPFLSFSQSLWYSLTIVSRQQSGSVFVMDNDKRLRTGPSRTGFSRYQKSTVIVRNFYWGRILNYNRSLHRRYSTSFSPCRSSSGIAVNLYVQDACPFMRGGTRNSQGSFSMSFIFSVPAQLPRGGRCHRMV